MGRRESAVVPLRTRLGVLSAGLFLLAVVASFPTWVHGFDAEQRSDFGVKFEESLRDVPGSSLLPVGWIVNRLTKSSGWAMPGVGPFIVLSVLAIAVCVLVGTRLGQPMVLVGMAWAGTLTASISGALLVVLMLLDANDLAGATKLTAEARGYLPDPEPGLGLWGFFFFAWLGSAAAGWAAVRCARRGANLQYPIARAPRGLPRVRGRS